MKIGSLKNVAAFKKVLEELGIELPCDDSLQSGELSSLSAPCDLGFGVAPNRYAAQPMEGWDGTLDGRPTDNTLRRWRRFGRSGAGLIFGGEAVAVRHEGRANPNQLLMSESSLSEYIRLRMELMDGHHEVMGETSEPVIGLQLTHSGRYCRPDGEPRPIIAYHHPVLDRRMGLDADYPVISDMEIEGIIADYVYAAVLAQRAGFKFVDVKHCHGYLGHELLGAKTRRGSYGGSLHNRTRYMREIIAGIKRDAPGLGVAVRLSAFDSLPFHPEPMQSTPGHPGPGIPEYSCDAMPYLYGFGVDTDLPTDMDLDEPLQLINMLQAMDVRLVNITAGSPYYNPHIQRPALYPPSDGYLPPEDPLIGVARQIFVTRYLKSQNPMMIFVGSAYTYLQDYLPNVAQAVVREGWTDFAGLGRMLLSYPELISDSLHGNPIDSRRICRTFSDCTSAPRAGLVSGCYPLDSYYKNSPEAFKLKLHKKR